MGAQPIADYIITPHAAIEMQRRDIDEETVRQVLSNPEQRLTVRGGRDVLQSKIRIEGTVYLVRVFVDINDQPNEVVTVYRTSKINKYWSKKP